MGPISLRSFALAAGGGAPGTANGLRSVREAQKHPQWNVDLKLAAVKELKRILGKAGPDNPGALERGLGRSPSA